MGRRLNVSQPVVVNTELKPLDIVFQVNASGQLEQWYYDNTGQWQPNRKVTPLILTPTITAVDTEANRSYTPTFYTVQWFVNEWKTSAYVESQIMNTVDGDVDYVIVGNTLKVKKNVNYDRGIQIRCRATYIDPRDVGKVGVTEEVVTLNCSKDALAEIPQLDVLCENSQPYNPLTMDNSIFTLNAVAYKGALEITNNIVFVWYAIINESEVLVDTQPFYVSGQNTRQLKVDALYKEEIRIVLRAKESANSDLYASKIFRSIVWRIPDIDSNVRSDNGQSFRSNITKMNFGTIINVKGRMLSEETKRTHMLFNWKTRQSLSSTEIDRGWGLNITLDNTALQSTNGSVLVYPIIYILGAYDVVTYNGENVTFNGEVLYCRFPD